MHDKPTLTIVVVSYQQEMQFTTIATDYTENAYPFSYIFANLLSVYCWF